MNQERPEDTTAPESSAVPEVTVSPEATAAPDITVEPETGPATQTELQNMLAQARKQARRSRRVTNG